MDTTLASLGVLKTPASVLTREGIAIPFDASRIEQAIAKCFLSINHTPGVGINELTKRVVNFLTAKAEEPSVEGIQDIVQMVLMSAGEFAAAEHYILYRAEHARQREDRPIPQEARQAFDDAARCFPTQLQQFQFFTKYSRFNYEKGRRETWVETVDRAVDYLKELSGYKLPLATYGKIREFILEMKAMPSMRLLAMAGEAARRDPIAIYNCSYQPVNSIDSFVEAMIISMNGCGVGYSVERRYVERFPRIKRQLPFAAKLNFTVQDTSEGWADALRVGLENWFAGLDVNFDLSLLRPAGTALKVKGGRASGPEPLRKVLAFARERILARQGAFLRPLDAHDIMCSIGNASEAGATRRTAMICLFDPDDEQMLHCKDGDFAVLNNQRWAANNSAVWPERELSQLEITEQMLTMAKSGRGEPGIFSRKAANDLAPERRKSQGYVEYGTNPCGEINLKPFQFCNLSIAVARSDDTIASLMAKVEVATIIGTIQAMATDFANLRPEWKAHCEQERLLGVDITGQLDCPVLQHADVLDHLREHAVAINEKYAALLGINQATAVTCCKPSGNSSQLLDCSSGIHARWAAFYSRQVRVQTSDPVYKVLRDAGVPMLPENGQSADNAVTWVAYFPVKAPEGAITRHDLTAFDQCEYWLLNKEHWTEHNPSVTITYKSDELLEIIQWVWLHQDKIGGMAFLPSYDADYAQLPYIEISQAEYEKRAAAFPVIDWSKIMRYEREDLTSAAQELACVAGCDIDWNEVGKA